MLFGDECIVRNDGIEIDAKELQPLGIADGSVVWGICRRPPGHSPHYVLSPIPPHAWGSSFKLAVRTFDRIGALQQLTEVLSKIAVNIIVYDSAPAGFSHCMVNLMCELPFSYQESIKSLRKKGRGIQATVKGLQLKLDKLFRQGKLDQCERIKMEVADYDMRLRRLHAMAGAKNLLMGTTVGLIVRLAGLYLSSDSLTTISKNRSKHGLDALSEDDGLIELNRLDANMSVVDVAARIDWLFASGGPRKRLQTCATELAMLINPLRFSPKFKPQGAVPMGPDRQECDAIRSMVETETEWRRGYLDIRFLFAENVYHEFRRDWGDPKSVLPGDEDLFLEALNFETNQGHPTQNVSGAVGQWMEGNSTPSKQRTHNEKLWDYVGQEWIWRQSRAVDNWISPTLLTCWFEDRPEENLRNVSV